MVPWMMLFVSLNKWQYVCDSVTLNRLLFLMLFVTLYRWQYVYEFVFLMQKNPACLILTVTPHLAMLGAYVCVQHYHFLMACYLIDPVNEITKVTKKTQEKKMITERGDVCAQLRV